MSQRGSRKYRSHSAPRIQPAPPSMLASSPDHPLYPKPIPAEKQIVARKLYHEYLRLPEDPPNQHHLQLSAPGSLGARKRCPPRARSGTSETSSVGLTTQSVASSNDGATDIISFTDGSISSNTNNNEYTACTGERVKVRKRKQFRPKARAKAAFIRHVGSCGYCHSHRVTVR